MSHPTLRVRGGVHCVVIVFWNTSETLVQIQRLLHSRKVEKNRQGPTRGTKNSRQKQEMYRLRFRLQYQQLLQSICCTVFLLIDFKKTLLTKSQTALRLQGWVRKIDWYTNTVGISVTVTTGTIDLCLQAPRCATFDK